jgi:DNA-binding MurR/RpiR family transcriptional regulator
MQPPGTYAELRATLQQELDHFAAGQRRIAVVILEDPAGTALRSIGETAKIVGAHPSSLVRFARTLGLAGYPAIVALCRQQLAQEAQLLSRFARAQERSATESLLSATIRHESENLHHTLSRVEPAQWDEAVRLLAETDRIHVMGLRKCAAVANLMSYLLRMVRPGVRQVAPMTGSLIDDIRDLRAGDVFVGISIERYTAETVRAFDEAKKRGLTTVALTDSAASPLAATADLTFLADCDGVTILRSVVGFIGLVQALATAVALHRGTSSRDELATDEELLAEFAVYWR